MTCWVQKHRWSAVALGYTFNPREKRQESHQAGTRRYGLKCVPKEIHREVRPKRRERVEKNSNEKVGSTRPHASPQTKAKQKQKQTKDERPEGFACRLLQSWVPIVWALARSRCVWAWHISRVKLVPPAVAHVGVWCSSEQVPVFQIRNPFGHTVVRVFAKVPKATLWATIAAVSATSATGHHSKNSTSHPL
jgi:hypothetical protein